MSFSHLCESRRRATLGPQALWPSAHRIRSQSSQRTSPWRPITDCGVLPVCGRKPTRLPLREGEWRCSRQWWRIRNANATAFSMRWSSSRRWEMRSLTWCDSPHRRSAVGSAAQLPHRRDWMSSPIAPTSPRGLFQVAVPEHREGCTHLMCSSRASGRLGPVAAGGSALHTSDLCLRFCGRPCARWS